MLRRGVLIVAGLAATAALTIPASAAAAVSCNLAANVLTVEVTGTGDQVATLKLQNGGTEIGVFTDLPGTTQQMCNVNPVPAATTTAIQVNDTEPGSSQRTLVNISLGGGPFLNSDATGEGAGDKEIEIVIDGGDESNDDLLLEPAPGTTSDNWRMGDLSNSAGDEGINLNDSETGDIDVDDVHALNMNQLQLGVNGNDGNDILDARGGTGFTGPMTMTTTVKQLVAGNGNDQIFAGEGDGWRVEGDVGADTMIGGGGNDLMQASFGTDADVIDGNGGTDTCSFLNHGDAVRVDLNISGPQDTLGAGMDTFSDCESLLGGNGADTLIGDGGPNSLLGLGGDDTLRPGPGAINDTVDGGAGTGDTVDYSDVTPSGVTLTLATAVAQNTGAYGMDTIAATENITGTPFADSLTGNTEINRIEGGDGVDTINLGDNDDVFDSFDALADTVDCGAGSDSGFASEPGVDALTDCEVPDFAPNTTVANGPPDGNLTNDDTPTYDLTASEAGVDFELSVDNGGFTACGASCDVPALADGQHTLRFRAVEQAGAEHPDPTPAERTVTVDRQAPSVTINSGPSGQTTQTSPTFGFSSTDSGAGFECRIDGAAFGACSGANSHTASGLSLGAHTFAVRATDTAGNSSVANRAFTVVSPPNPTTPDTTAPNTQIRRVKVKGKTVRIRFRSTEAGSRFRCKLDRRKARPCSSPKIYRNLRRGRHVVRISAIDAAGNVDRTPARARFRIR